MVAPVSDERPWIVWLDYFPVDAITRDAIGIISVDGGGIDEFGDHGVDIARERKRKGLPVLEDISPVSLIVAAFASVVFANLDRELVPWAARVAMSATKGDRQVLIRDSNQIRIACSLCFGDEFLIRNSLR